VFPFRLLLSSLLLSRVARAMASSVGHSYVHTPMQCTARNVLGLPLHKCGSDSLPTGFLRDNYCVGLSNDPGQHVVCAVVTAKFLEYTKSRGNDLSTPREMFSFPGLRPGDRWCLCVRRWKEAYDAGVAPSVYLSCTHESALSVVTLDMLKEHALDPPTEAAKSAPASSSSSSSQSPDSEHKAPLSS
jgi:uncharacterized protein